jgi:hypothetical protein
MGFSTGSLYLLCFPITEKVSICFFISEILTKCGDWHDLFYSCQLFLPLTPPHSMHFKAPRIIWMGLEGAGM